MRRNVAGQFIGAQLISKTDGSPVTSGTTTVYVTGDAGTQAAGSVGSGICTHEGNGYFTYTPSQSETDYSQVAFTFVNTSACNATVQVYPYSYSAGSVPVTITVTVGGVAVDGVAVYITTDVAGANVTAGTLYTDAFGQVTFNLDPGAYYVWKQHSGYNFTNPETITVTA